MFIVRRHSPTRGLNTIGTATRRARTRSRRGLALMIVMVALGTSLVVTLAFVRTQSTMLQIRRNAQRTDLALQAAHTGAAVGLERIHDTTWTGVTETLVRDVYADAQGTASYTVEFQPLDPSSTAEDVGFRLIVASTGAWQSLEHADERVEKRVEVEVRLLPRLAGRPINAGDSVNAGDEVANEQWFEDIQGYALFALGLGGSLQSLDIEPRARIDGNAWIRQKLDLYPDVGWGAAIREDYLESVGNLYVDGSNIYPPHPFNGSLTFHTTPDSALTNDLSDLQVPWSVTTELPGYAGNLQVSDWTPYVIYDGGFQYDAVALGASVQDVTLGPTADNPLGIFYSSSDVTLYDNVTIQGTIVCTGRVTIDGDSVRIASVNWRDSGGTAYVDNIDLWPRLPSIVATRVKIERETQTSIDGAVFARVEFIGGGGDFEYSSASDADITGTATSQLAGQPLSVVSLQGTPDLSGLNDAEDYAIWLEEGTSGSWHPIVGVDVAGYSLTVVGEVVRNSPTNYRIRRNRREYVDIRGPLMTKSADLRHAEEWLIGSANWDERHTSWDNDGEFVDWLADETNFSGWAYPYNVYGLSLEPTFQIKYDGSSSFHWKPQLFDAYDGTGPDAEFAGYRWEVISWREAS